jgi:hypothetical protein
VAGSTDDISERKRMNTFRRIATTASAFVVLLATPAAVATAAAAPAVTPSIPGYQFVHINVSLPPGGFVRDAAICPAGTVVLGGGALAAGGSSANRLTELQESAPDTTGIAPEYLWMAAVSNHSANAYTLQIYAVCASAPAGYQIVEQTRSLPAGGFVSGVPGCPAGKVVIGGGASVVNEGSANFNTQIEETAPATTGGQPVWFASVRSYSTVNHTLGVWAVCATQPPGYRIVERDYSLAPGAFVQDVATCPAGTTAMGGGAKVIGESPADYGMQIQASAPGGFSYLNAVSNLSGAHHTLGMFATCATT